MFLKRQLRNNIPESLLSHDQQNVLRSVLQIIAINILILRIIIIEDVAVRAVNIIEVEGGNNGKQISFNLVSSVTHIVEAKTSS
jgi:hypothetical protein